MNRKQLEDILEKHKKWLRGEDGGERADLQDADLLNANLQGADLQCAYLRNANLWNANLQDADLRNADLWNANLWRADLQCAYLRNANLQGADLQDADLQDADLRNADLWNANLWRADLQCANLRNANLWNANLQGADLRRADLQCAYLRDADLQGVVSDAGTSFFAIQCPEKGSFTAFKKAGEYVVELAVPEDAKRSSATSRKCRCNKATVVQIWNTDGTLADITEIASNHDADFVYKVGEKVEVSDFNEDRWKECSAGIHFFITFDEAKNY